VEGGRATLELPYSDHCKSCGICTAAAAGTMHIDAPAIEGLEPGQTVAVSIDRSVSLGSALMLFGVPLLGLVAGSLIGNRWPLPGMTNDISAAVLGLVLMALTFLVALVYERKVARHKHPEPVILRIEDEPGEDE
jgi:positive regulator of sigma E activity